MIFNKGKKILEMVDAHYEQSLSSFDHFSAFLEEYLSNGASEAALTLMDKIDEEERKADELRRSIVTEFLNGGMLAQTRSEILKIVTLVDGIANKCQSLCKLMVYQKVSFMGSVKEDLREMLRLTQVQLEFLSEAIEALFSNYEPLLKDSKQLEAVKHNEELIDEIEIGIIKTLFESDADLSEKNQQRYFVSKIADISDLIENIADEVQIMVVFRKI